MVYRQILNKNLLVIAGEASGDLHGASLIRELIRIDNSISVCGIGGSRMQAEGMELLFNINQMAFLGFAEIIRHIPFIKKVQARLLEEVRKRNIKTVVLIDYPGFNLSIADKLKKLGVRIIYYISPQVWAWGKGRIKKIRRVVDKMIVILPFEEKFFRNAGIEVEYIGHPLLEQIENYKYLSREEFYKKFSLDENKKILLVLPGSRMQEVRKIFPEAISAAGMLAAEFDLQVVVACSSNIDESVFRELSPEGNFAVIKEHTYDLYKQAELGIIKSGTSTLEAALFSLPMVVVYVTNYLTYLIGRNLIRIDNISLVNIVADERIIDELIQNDVNRRHIYEVCKGILADRQKYEHIKEKLTSLHLSLGSTGVSKRGAEIVYDYLTDNSLKETKGKHKL